MFDDIDHYYDTKVLYIPRQRVNASDVDICAAYILRRHCRIGRKLDACAAGEKPFRLVQKETVPAAHFKQVLSLWDDLLQVLEESPECEPEADFLQVIVAISRCVSAREVSFAFIPLSHDRFLYPRIQVTETAIPAQYNVEFAESVYNRIV